MSPAQILNGKACAETIKSELADKLKNLKVKPGLGTILVGDDAGSHSYVNGKHRDCAQVGINSIRIDLPATASQSDVLKAISDLETVAGRSILMELMPTCLSIRCSKSYFGFKQCQRMYGIHCSVAVARRNRNQQNS